MLMAAEKITSIVLLGTWHYRTVNGTAEVSVRWQNSTGRGTLLT